MASYRPVSFSRCADRVDELFIFYGSAFILQCNYIAISMGRSYPDGVICAIDCYIKIIIICSIIFISIPRPMMHHPKDPSDREKDKPLGSEMQEDAMEKPSHSHTITPD